MRVAEFTEKRKFKRLDLVVPAKIKHTTDKGKEEMQEGVAINVSFNGAFVVNINLKSIKANDDVKVSFSVPREDNRDFPFSRLVGNAKVVRVEKDGMGLKFHDDINRLFIAN